MQKLPVPKLSICVPTYNRSKELIRMFESARGFEAEEFEFVVCDDGSTDDTESVVRTWMAVFQIRFIKLPENRGRARALHSAFVAARGEFVMPMDSDDIFATRAFTIIKNSIERLDAEGGRLVGAIFECCGEDGKIVGKALPLNVSNANFSQLRADYRITGDKKEMVRRDLLLATSIKPLANERRLPTSTYWHALSRLGSVLIVREPVVCKHYLAGGMTKSLSKTKWESPSGLALCYKLALGNYSKCYKSKTYAVMMALKLAKCWIYMRMAR